MTVLQFLVLLLVAAIIGALGQALTGYRRGGLLVSIVVGFIGALLGFLLARELHLPDLLVIRVANETIPVIWSIVGAAVAALLIGAVSRPAYRGGFRRWRY